MASFKKAWKKIRKGAKSVGRTLIKTHAKVAPYVPIAAAGVGGAFGGPVGSFLAGTGATGAKVLENRVFGKTFARASGEKDAKKYIKKQQKKILKTGLIGTGVVTAGFGVAALAGAGTLTKGPLLALGSEAAKGALTPPPPPPSQAVAPTGYGGTRDDGTIVDGNGNVDIPAMVARELSKAAGGFFPGGPPPPTTNDPDPTGESGIPQGGSSDRVGQEYAPAGEEGEGSGFGPLLVIGAIAAVVLSRKKAG